jgi:hypothetical protein
MTLHEQIRSQKAAIAQMTEALEILEGSIPAKYHPAPGTMPPLDYLKAELSAIATDPEAEAKHQALLSKVRESIAQAEAPLKALEQSLIEAEGRIDATVGRMQKRCQAIAQLQNDLYAEITALSQESESLNGDRQALYGASGNSWLSYPVAEHLRFRLEFSTNDQGSIFANLNAQSGLTSHHGNLQYAAVK